MEIKTRYGTLHDCINIERHADGSLASCMVRKRSTLSVQGKSLIPQYHFDDSRRKYIPSAVFYADGTLHKLALDESQDILTPLGSFPAEYLTFYPDGSLCRLFPLNGKLSGYWSEKDELARAVPFSFSIGEDTFRCKIISLHFYASGSLRSLTLAPGETILLHTPQGSIKTRIGFALYENGSLASLEPAMVQTIDTPIGLLPIFDSLALGIHADTNSLEFNPTGQIKSCKTMASIRVETDQATCTVSPEKIPAPLTDDMLIPIPTKLIFTERMIILLQKSREFHIPLSGTKFYTTI